MESCRTCELIERRDRGEAPFWDQIFRTPWWDVVHCYGTSVEGWLVLVAREHVGAVAELADEACLALGPLLKRASVALHEQLGCEKTYVAQFAEHPLHPHVHFHVIPRAADHPDDRKGPRVFELLGIPDDQCISEDRMNDVAALVAPYFTRFAPS
jgi:diadenosine tetraphosphate (Ap4A) HIT family hydrolase